MLKIHSITQDELSDILDNIEDHGSYYVGGTLCIDKVLPEGDVLCVQLDETFNSFSTGETRVMTIKNIRKAFAIYLKHKGDRPYYRESLAKSCLRYLN